jgi:Tol biopolymer transport system component
VAYLSDSGGRANVWVASVDGSSPPRKITDEQDPETVVGVPRWSPKGDGIVFVKSRVGGESEEWLVNPDGTGQRLLVQNARAAAWSHDGEWIYYLAGAGSITNTMPCIYKIRPTGGDPVKVRCGAAAMIVASDGITGYFSPTSDRLGEIWKAKPVETGSPEPLVTTLQSRIPLWPHHYDLSSDDLWLAMPLKDRGTTNLWAVSTKDGSFRQITDFQERATLIGRQVAWSGNKYIFAAVVEMDADVVLLEGAIP